MKTFKKIAREPRAGIIFNIGACWVGCHYSPYNKRYCINFVPFVTFWFIKKEGHAPQRAYR